MKALALTVLVVSSMVALGVQAQSGMIGGTVRDTRGAPIPGVTVTATNGDTGKGSTLITNEAGAYTFSGLPAGPYTISAALPGFATKRFMGLRLEPSLS